MRLIDELPHNVKVLSWVSFFQDAASEMLYPVLPLFVVGVLKAPPSALGIIEGVAEATASGSKALAGRLADRMRKKPLIAFGYGLSSLAKPAIGLAGAWPAVAGARFVDRVGKGVRGTPRDALIADETPPEMLGRAFGFHRAADTAGAVAGPLIGLALYYGLSLQDHLRTLFFIAFIPGALSAGIVAFVHDTKATVRTKKEDRGPLPPQYRRALVVLTLFGLVNFADAFLLLRAGILGLGFTGVVLVYVLYNVVYAAASLPAGTWSDRVPKPYILGGGLAVFAVAYAGLGLTTSKAWVWVLLPVYGLFTALTDGVGKAWISELLPKGRRGTGLGLFQGITGGASLVAGIWAGLAWHGSGRRPLLIAGGVALCLAPVVAAIGRDRPGAAAATAATGGGIADPQVAAAPPTDG
jgi:MFS family permease